MRKHTSWDQNISYSKSLKETHGSYSFSKGPNVGLIRIWPKFVHFCLLIFKFSVGLIRIRVLFEGGSLLRIYGIYSNIFVFRRCFHPVILSLVHSTLFHFDFPPA